MVTFPPLFPRVSWFKTFFSEIIKGESEDSAIVKANIKVSNPKDFARLRLLDNQGEEKVLSVPVEGGGRQLRSFEKIKEGLTLSEHGDWRKVHLGAIEAILGRHPFYKHISPSLTAIYTSEGNRELREFNFAIYRFVLAFLLGNIPLDEFATNLWREEVKERGKEISQILHPDISIIQALADYGQESLLGVAYEKI